jgi:hypothetical protein
VKLFSCAVLVVGCTSKTPFMGSVDSGIDTGPMFNQDSSTAPPTEVYGHTASNLYRLNPVTKEVDDLGTFKGCVYVNDIAIDQSSNLYGVTGTQLVSLDSSARCSVIATGLFPNSLSFVPAGVLSSTEVLVGYEGGDYVKIDPMTGMKTKVGQIGMGLTSSGDIVSVIGGKTFVTVKGQGCNDCLAEVSAQTGALVKNWGPLGFTDVFGLAFWGGKLYGFANDGSLFEVTLQNDMAVSTLIPIPNQMAGLMWAGAGSTTSAPLMPIK